MAAIDPTNLAKAMELSNFSAKDLAEDLGISLSYLCDILSGRRTLKRNSELRHKIAEKLDVPYTWIETRREAS